MSVADYLAKRYLGIDSPADSPTRKSKKRKLKHQEAPSSLFASNDDQSGFIPSTRHSDDDDDERPVVVGGVTVPRNARSAQWKIISKAPSSAGLNGRPSKPPKEDVAADAIIAEVEEEKRRREADDGDGPTLVDIPKMESGARAGLQMAADVAADAARLKKAEARRKAAALQASGKEAETVYRDASGRVVDIAMKREEQREKVEEDKRRKKEEDEQAKGEVQRRAKEDRKQRLEDARLMGVARYADDKELNAELKEQTRWGDTMLSYGGDAKAKKSRSGRPLYQGHAPPNRYGIKPGYRWDGVDRSIGFEKEWFAARNKKTMVQNLEYQWQMDE